MYNQLNRMMIKNIILAVTAVIHLTAAMIDNSTLQLPPECTNYLIMNDASRSVHHGTKFRGYCDDDYPFFDTSPDWQGSNKWYRMMPPAGVVIPQTPAERDHCGTEYPGTGF